MTITIQHSRASCSVKTTDSGAIRPGLEAADVLVAYPRLPAIRGSSRRLSRGGQLKTSSANGPSMSAAETAYFQLRELIVHGTLRPGEVVNEQELADHLGLGRTPVREAVQRLAWQKVVTIFPRRGMAVAKLGFDDILGIFEARETIEVKIAELAALRRTAQDVEALEQLRLAVERSAESGEYYRFLGDDQALHRGIARAARNSFLEETVDHLLMLSAWIWHQYFGIHGPHRTNHFRHSEIIQAIIDQDESAARVAMSEHIQQSRKLIRSVV